MIGLLVSRRATASSTRICRSSVVVRQVPMIEQCRLLVSSQMRRRLWSCERLREAPPPRRTARGGHPSDWRPCRQAAGQAGQLRASCTIYSLEYSACPRKTRSSQDRDPQPAIAVQLVSEFALYSSSHSETRIGRASWPWPLTISGLPGPCGWPRRRPPSAPNSPGCRTEAVRPVLRARGRVLAADLVAGIDLPMTIIRRRRRFCRRADDLTANRTAAETGRRGPAGHPFDGA